MGIAASTGIGQRGGSPVRTGHLVRVPGAASGLLNSNEPPYFYKRLISS